MDEQLLDRIVALGKARNRQRHYARAAEKEAIKAARLVDALATTIGCEATARAMTLVDKLPNNRRVIAEAVVELMDTLIQRGKQCQNSTR